MRRFLLELQFNGKNYSGFQRQKNAATVQGTVERALEKLFDASVPVTGCSRTDAGVSAESYFCHFDAETKLPETRVCFKLNRFLPKDIQAISSREVPFSFDARKNVKRKTYCYSLYASEHVLPLYSPFRVRIGKNADIAEMCKAASFLTGKHDFSSFRTIGYEEDAERKNTVRTIYDIRISEHDGLIDVYLTADGFLYNMVRIIVGTLVEVGEGTRLAESVKVAIEAKDRAFSGRTMPPKGLRLFSVEY